MVFAKGDELGLTISPPFRPSYPQIRDSPDHETLKLAHHDGGKVMQSKLHLLVLSRKHG